MSRGEILKTHYLGLFRKAATWAGLVALLLLTLGPVGTAEAAQITARSATLSTSAPDATGVTATFVFNPGQTATVEAITFSLCTSPLSAVACASPSGATVAAATAGTQTGTNITNQYGSPSYTSTTAVRFSHASGNALNLSNPVTFPVQNIEIPTAANSQFYLRIQTWANDDGTGPLDYGAVAVSTARQIAVSANVQENLSFCVGTSGTGCAGGGLTGTTVNLGTGSENVLSSSVPSGGVSLMAAETNAASGYGITYFAANLDRVGGGATITASGGTSSGFVAGTDEFGINLIDNATPDIGAAASGATGGITYNTQYDNTDQFAFVPSTTTSVVTKAAPSLETLYTVAYAAQAGTTTPSGQYTTTFTYVATGLF